MEFVIYLSVENLLTIHRRTMDEFGGDPGLRDRGLLESAAAMPQATFGGVDLHPDLLEKAAAYLFHLCTNHAFVDGNKRVALAAAELFLLLNGRELLASDDKVEELTMGVANGTISKVQVIGFFQKHVGDETK